jgi:hypothetical protein
MLPQDEVDSHKIEYTFLTKAFLISGDESETVVPY